MGLLDFTASNGPGDSSPAQQNWINALGALSASLKDAGAFMQHQPEAANNVANFLRQRSAPQASPVQAMLAQLPPHVLVPLILSAAQYSRPASPAVLTPPAQTG
jgi:hypothetical protein